MLNWNFVCYIETITDPYSLAFGGTVGLRGIANLAFTANKWSRLAIKLFTCSSSLTFSVRS